MINGWCKGRLQPVMLLHKTVRKGLIQLLSYIKAAPLENVIVTCNAPYLL